MPESRANVANVSGAGLNVPSAFAVIAVCEPVSCTINVGLPATMWLSQGDDQPRPNKPDALARSEEYVRVASTGDRPGRSRSLTVDHNSPVALLTGSTHEH